MRLKLFQVDAFSAQRFGGNPAAVCPLDYWLADELLQKIAEENNLSETAFYVPVKDGFHIRWFTPVTEVDLCGHATLASAHVLMQHEGWDANEVIFDSKSGKLTIYKLEPGKYKMDFPIDNIKEIAITPSIEAAISVPIKKLFRGKDDYMAVIESEEQLRKLQPNFHLIKQLNSRGLIVTAPGESVHFVSRGFFPQCGVDEDPATGSAHTTLTPYWAKILRRKKLRAIQLSARKGHFECHLKGDRVHITGHAATYLIGDIWT